VSVCGAPIVVTFGTTDEFKTCRIPGHHSDGRCVKHSDDPAAVAWRTWRRGRRLEQQKADALEKEVTTRTLARCQENRKRIANAVEVATYLGIVADACADL